MLNKLVVQKLSLLLADAFSMLLAFLVALLLTENYHLDLINVGWAQFFNFGASKLLGLIILALFWYDQQYSKRRPFWEELLQIYRIIGLFILINLGMSFVMAKGSLKILIVGFWLSFALILPILRYLCKLILSRLQLWQRDLFIIGYGATALEAFNLFAQNKLMGYRLVAFVNPEQSEPNSVARNSSDGSQNRVSVNTRITEAHLPARLIAAHELRQRLASNANCEIIIALSGRELNQHVGLINFLQHNCLAVLILPEISGVALYGAQVEHFFGNDQLILRLNNNLAQKGNRWLKRVFDATGVLLGLVLLSPLFVLIALAIKFSTGNKVFYRHQRIGKNGKPFYCLKFQTMTPNSAELLAQLLKLQPELQEEWSRDFKLKNDPRVTKIGAWLRNTSLDELPQLFNVLKGEMSLVGPRPIIAAEIERYKEGIYYYQMVSPGITGLWQVSGRSDIDYSNRVRLDEWYVKNWSLWYDIVILIKTIGVVLRRSGAY